MLDNGESQKEAIRPDFNMLRQFYVWGEEVKRSIEWLIKRLIKVGARVSYHARRWHVHVASAFPLAHHWRAVLSWGSLQALKRFRSCLKGCYALRPKQVVFEVRLY